MATDEPIRPTSSSGGSEPGDAPTGAAFTPSDTGLALLRNAWRDFTVAVGEPCRVLGIDGSSEAIVRYVGPTHLGPGDWAGLELLRPDGDHDGEVDGRRYFMASQLHGLLVRVEQCVSALPEYDLLVPRASPRRRSLRRSSVPIRETRASRLRSEATLRAVAISAAQEQTARRLRQASPPTPPRVSPPRTASLPSRSRRSSPADPPPRRTSLHPPPQGRSLRFDYAPPAGLPPSPPVAGAHRAVCVGCSYRTAAEAAPLDGCPAAARQCCEWLERQGFAPPASVELLADDSGSRASAPTRRNILSALDWLVEGAEPDRAYFFLFAGHSGWTTGPSPHPPGTPDAVLPLDYATEGVISAEDQLNIFCRLPPGAQLLAVWDCAGGGGTPPSPWAAAPAGGGDAAWSWAHSTGSWRRCAQLILLAAAPAEPRGGSPPAGALLQSLFRATDCPTPPRWDALLGILAAGPDGVVLRPRLGTMHRFALSAPFCLACDAGGLAPPAESLTWQPQGVGGLLAAAGAVPQRRHVPVTAAVPMLALHTLAASTESGDAADSEQQAGPACTPQAGAGPVQAYGADPPEDGDFWPMANPLDRTPCESWRTPQASHRSPSPGASSGRRGLGRGMMSPRSSPGPPQRRGVRSRSPAVGTRLGGSGVGEAPSDPCGVSIEVTLPDATPSGGYTLRSAATAVLAELRSALSQLPAEQPASGDGAEEPTSLRIRVAGGGVAATLVLALEGVH
eukprot:TRINITY_DN27012_c0_g1_i1.p1 TRINITY_DN27012_c0_g1~~TRINITY_DN27012_c0_g1_i1.p1  ORF type:complete len:735 (+),score=109.56 TRINITY_DN27012_c0_g1_i1:87-2291(+)